MKTKLEIQVPFKQENIIEQDKKLPQERGLCNGLCIFYAVEYLHHNRNIIKTLNDHATRRRKKFREVVMTYQYKLQTSNMVDTYKREILIFDNDRPDHIVNRVLNTKADASVIGVSFLGPHVRRGHIIVITRFYDQKGEKQGFKIFDPNYGEINCNIDAVYDINYNKLVRQFTLLYNEYKAIGFSEIHISDLENFVNQARFTTAHLGLENKEVTEVKKKVKKIRADNSKYIDEQKFKKIRANTTNYTYEQKNDYLKKLVKHEAINKEEIYELVMSGANPNLLRTENGHKSSIGYNIRQDNEVMSLLLKKAINQNNVDLMQGIIQLAGERYSGAIRIKQHSAAQHALNNNKDNLAIELLKINSEFLPTELTNNRRAAIVKLASKNVNAIYDGEPILAHAISGDSQSLVTYLLNSPEIDINKPCRNGSFLQQAIKLGKTEIVKTLLQKGADIERVDAEGKSALENAHGHAEILTLLQDRVKPVYSIFVPRKAKPVPEQKTLAPIQPIVPEKKIIENRISRLKRTATEILLLDERATSSARSR